MQKGKFSACAEDFVSTLKKVDLPTFGSPTMPTLRLVPTRPMRGLGSGTAGFLGGISSHCFEENFVDCTVKTSAQYFVG